MQLEAQLVHLWYCHVVALRTWVTLHIHHTHEQTASFHSIKFNRLGRQHTQYRFPWPHHKYQPRVFVGEEVIHQVVSQWCSLVLSLVFAFGHKSRCCPEPVHKTQTEFIKWKRATGRNRNDIAIMESQQLPRKRNTKSGQGCIQANDWKEAAMEKAGPDHPEAPIHQWCTFFPDYPMCSSI